MVGALYVCVCNAESMIDRRVERGYVGALREKARGTERHESVRTPRRRASMSADDVASATDLTSYGDALIAACVAYAETAARFVDDDDDEKNAAGTDDVDAMTTRACVRACARLDAEATKGTCARLSLCLRLSLARTRD